MHRSNEARDKQEMYCFSSPFVLPPQIDSCLALERRSGAAVWILCFAATLGSKSYLYSFAALPPDAIMLNDDPFSHRQQFREAGQHLPQFRENGVSAGNALQLSPLSNKSMHFPRNTSGLLQSYVTWYQHGLWLTTCALWLTALLALCSA